MPSPNTRRPRSAPVVHRTKSASPARPRSAPARMMTASIYKSMSPAQQMNYAKNVKMSQWPTDRRTSKALILAILASMIKPTSGLFFNFKDAYSLTTVYATARETGRQIDKLSGIFPQAVIASIIIIAFIHAINAWKKTGLQEKQLNMMIQMFTAQQAQIAAVIQNPPRANAPVISAPAARLAISAARPTTTNANLIARMPNRPRPSSSRM